MTDSFLGRRGRVGGAAPEANKRQEPARRRRGRQLGIQGADCRRHATDHIKLVHFTQFCTARKIHDDNVSVCNGAMLVVTIMMKITVYYAQRERKSRPLPHELTRTKLKLRNYISLVDFCALCQNHSAG